MYWRSPFSIVKTLLFHIYNMYVLESFVIQGYCVMASFWTTFLLHFVSDIVLFLIQTMSLITTPNMKSLWLSFLSLDRDSFLYLCIRQWHCNKQKNSVSDPDSSKFAFFCRLIRINILEPDPPISEHFRTKSKKKI